jgi:hypothetical protein
VFRRRRDEKTTDSAPHNQYSDLRAMALRATESGVLPAPSPEHPDVSGLVIDIPSSGGTATLVALTDDTTSLYTSTGGGTIGAGQHANVATATQVLLAAAQQHMNAFSQRDDRALPPTGSVRFHLLSPFGQRAVDVPEDAFWGRVDHPFMPVIAAAQNLISAMQQV